MKKSEPHIKYFDMGPYPIYLGFTVNYAKFNLEMKRLGVEGAPLWVNGGSDATTHFLTKDDTPVHNTAIICIKRRKGITEAQVTAMVVHEVVHVWEFINKCMRTSCPGGEHQAYGIQFMVQRILEEIARNKR